MSKSPIRIRLEKESSKSITRGDKLIYKNDGMSLGSGAKSFGAHPVIYIGQDKVVHAQNDGKKGIIKQNSIREEGFIENEGHYGSCFEIIGKAIDSVGNTFDYDLINRNCQHYASYCQGDNDFDFSSVGISGGSGSGGSGSGGSGSGGSGSGCEIF